MASKILHGPYGDSWAYRVEIEGVFDRGWMRADSEAAAIEKAREELVTFRRDPDEAIVDRVTPTVREPKTGDNNRREDGYSTDGHYIEHALVKGEQVVLVDIPFGGACPVQGTGEVDGLPAYYRARGNGWSLSIELSDNEEWTYGEAPYAWPDGGWLHRDESMANIAKAVEALRTRQTAEDQIALKRLDGD